MPGATPADDIMIGVGSFGRGCGLSYLPGVYMNVPYYSDWLQEQVCDMVDSDDDKPSYCFEATAPEPPLIPSPDPPEDENVTVDRTSAIGSSSILSMFRRRDSN